MNKPLSPRQARVLHWYADNGHLFYRPSKASIIQAAKALARFGLLYEGERVNSQDGAYRITEAGKVQAKLLAQELE